MTGAILITGAAKRLGKALALGLAEKGWQIAIHYNHSQDAAKALASQINQQGGTAEIIKADFSNDTDIDRLITQASKELNQPITALINNASAFDPDQIQSFDRQSYDQHMQVNLYAALKLSQNFAAQLVGDQKGCIINLIDQRVLKPNPEYFTYTLSKSAMLWATKTMAQALAPHIRVNGVGPGPTLKNTRQSQAIFEHEAAHTLLGYGSPPQAIIKAVLYLLSAQSVTGQMLAVDGGQHLTWQTEDLISGNV